MATKAQLEQRIVHLETELAIAHAAIAERDKRIETLEERLARLEARLNVSSANSSLPPSKNPPHVKPGRNSKPTGKPPGARPGHKPATFNVDPDAVTEHVECEPASRCDYCLAELADAPLVLGEPAKPFYQLEVPPMALNIIAYNRPRRQCDHCCRYTVAPLPAGVGPSPFGPNMVALIASLTVRYRLGRRPVAALLEDLFGRHISVGAIQSALETASDAVAEAVEALRAHVEASPVVGADETGWRDQTGFGAGKRPWLWMATTRLSTVYAIAPDRGVEGSRTVLGSGFGGIVVCDRWKPYESRFGVRRQLCWAHIAREALSAVERGVALTKTKDARLYARGQQLEAWGRAFESAIDRLFELWHAYRAGKLSRRELQAAMTRVKLKVARLLLRGRRLDDPKMKATAKDIWRQFSCLWRFVVVEGVEPTNNESEREVRPAVIARGLMLSTKSAAGRLLFTRLLSVSATCRKQGRDMLEFLKTSLVCRAQGMSPPSLVPS